ncbi:MAG: FAD-binding oxidoreductase [Rhodospirillaceae bacterium]|nr:FAD-binding oxidoreductase [Rhodospirillaceae bacterium]
MPDQTRPAFQDLADRLRAIVGERGLVTDPDALAPHLIDWRRRYFGRTPFMVRPATVDEVSAVVAACADAGVSMVPQGGNTGLVGGSVPDETGLQVLVNLGRLNRVRELDRANYTITVEAGCILADIQQAAAADGMLFPLSLGAEGSCQIGGNLSTNAGGNAVLHYGNMRDLVLGLEVVLPDGRVWQDLRGLRKDNTGYDLKHLFIGAEGSLGIITAAILKLFPAHADSQTALVALHDLSSVMALFDAARRRSGDQLVAFELMPRVGIDLALQHVTGAIDPLEERYPHYVLLELASSRSEAGLRAALEEILEAAFEEGWVVDGTIAATEEQARQLWFLREAIVEGQRLNGASIKHDVSVKTSRMGDFIDTAKARLAERFPDDRVVAFGHVGDGNVHFNICPPAGDETGFAERGPAFTEIVFGTVAEFGGSISAEHGIGRLRREKLADVASPVDLELMRRIKQAVDPANLMNPHVLFVEPSTGSDLDR